MDNAIRRVEDLLQRLKRYSAGTTMRRVLKARLRLLSRVNERLDTPEDLAARERMLDGVEQRFYQRGLDNIFLDRIKDQSHGG